MYRTAKGTINGESIDLECISGKFSHDNYDNPNVSGKIEIISERIYCDNCKVLVDMFETEFPNIKVTRVEVVK